MSSTALGALSALAFFILFLECTQRGLDGRDGWPFPPWAWWLAAIGWLSAGAYTLALNLGWA